MKRIAIKLVVFVMLGAVVTVGVAWGCVMGMPGYRSGSEFVTAELPEPWGPTKRDVFLSTNLAVGVRIDCFLVVDRRHLSDWFIVCVAGWPCPALQGAEHLRQERRTTMGVLDSWWRTRHRMRPAPHRPLWPGFFTNTLFYAVILWALWSAPFAARRIIRRRRGRCVRCGYDLRYADHDACPECGQGFVQCDQVA